MAGSGGRAIARWAMAVPAVAVPVLAIERLWHAQAARHPYVAFAAVCGYELALVAARFGAKVAAGLRGRLEEGVTDEAILAAMVAHPILVNRPIVCTARGVRLCRPSEAVLELMDKFPPGPFTKEDGALLIDADGKRVG